VEGCYRYMEDLIALERASGPPPSGLPPCLCLASPLNVEAWRTEFKTFPDEAFKSWLLRGICNGFRIGIPADFSCSSSQRNMPSAYEHEEVVQAYLGREVTLGRMSKLDSAEVASLASLGLQISPFGVIPKRHRPGKWRLIVNLSAPWGESANSAINPELSSISYTSIDQAATLVYALGKGCLLAKLDLQEAYRAVPVHPADQPKLGVRWKGDVYIDRALPFGLRSAPKLFSAISDACMWILHTHGVRFGLHYLDDFLLVGPAQSQESQQALDTTMATFASMGLSVAPEKTEGPTTSLVFLGIEIDTLRLQLRLPPDKKARLSAGLSE